MGIFFTQIVDPNVIPVDDYFRVGKNEVGVDALLDAAAQGSVDYQTARSPKSPMLLFGMWSRITQRVAKYGELVWLRGLK